MDKITKVTIATGAFGVLATLAIATGTLKASFRVLALSSLLAFPMVAIGQVVADNRAERRVREVKRELDTLTKENQELQKLALANQQLSKRLDALSAQMCQAQKELREHGEIRRQSLEQIYSQTLSIEALKIENQKLLRQVEEYEENYSSELEREIEQGIQAYKDSHKAQLEAKYRSVFDEAISLIVEARKLPEEYKAWGEQVSDRLNEQKGWIKGQVIAFNNAIDEEKSDYEREKAVYLEEIELLREKVARLQQRLAGDLVHFEKLECGFDQNGHVANAIGEWLWNHRRIPLKVTGFEESDGVITAGYAYSRSTTPEDLSKVIQDNSPAITRSLGLYALETPQKLKIADVLTVKIRRERPQRKTDKGSLYRSKEDFINYILSQPLRLRIIGEPGSGKTPTVAILLSHLLNRGFLSGNTPNGQKVPYCVVESCNPLAGISVKNGEALDFCLRWNSGAKGFRGLAEEYKFRKNPANGNYKNQVGYIWVADEIDNTMAAITKDEAKPFKDALKDGGHVNLGVIVMGQSAMVSTSKGLSIDDQKMMTNIYIDPVSIRTFLTQYGERFYAKKAVERALKTLEELELEIEEQNEIICDSAREFRIAMVTANRSPVFYQLPYFDSADIDVDRYQEILAKVSAIRDERGETRVAYSVPVDSGSAYTAIVSGRQDTDRHSPMSGLGTRLDTSVKPNCPHCGSSNIRSKGDKWVCQNPEHSILASDKPKSWKK